MVEFKEYPCNSASEFLEALRLSNEEWWPHQSEETPDPEWQRDWIFRGQSSAKWELLPTAWRNVASNVTSSPVNQLKKQLWINLRSSAVLTQVHIYLYKYAMPPRELSERESKQMRGRYIRLLLHAIAEYSLISEFTKLADDIGFRVAPLPEYESLDSFIRTYLRRYFPDDVRHSGDYLHGIPYAQLNEEKFAFWANQTVALAQHHGVPTRLLDWTRNPITAAFFAAKDIKTESVDDKIIVYALHKKMLAGNIRYAEVPASSNDFLRAQAGLFTVDLNADAYLLANGRFPSLEASVRQQNLPLKPYEQPKKFLLPVLEAPKLMRLLWLERVTHAHLMPTLDHVAEAALAKVRLSENLDILNRWR